MASGNSKYLAFLALPMEIMVLQVGFFFAGRWLDQRLGSAPICTIAGPILGFVIWIFHLVIMIRSVSHEPSDPADEETSAREAETRPGKNT